MMIDFKNLNYDPKDILSKYERIESLTKVYRKIKSRISKLREDFGIFQTQAEGRRIQMEGLLQCI